MARSRVALPAPLASATRRFERWRAERTTHRIPEELWSLAADLGARHGVSRTSRALHVQYGDLKKRVEEGRQPGTEDGAPPAFVEIGSAPSTMEQPGSCRVEFKRVSGDKMMIQLGGACHADLTDLARLFLGRRR